MESFGEEHRKFRLDKTDFTLRQYAKALGVSPAYVSNVEKGLEPPFSEALLKKSVRLMHLSEEEERRLFTLRQASAQKKEIQRFASQLARKTSHLSQEEFDEMLSQTRTIKEKKEESST